MQPAKICQIITTLGPAGAERCVCDLATRIDKSRFSVSVIALANGPVKQELQAAGIQVFSLDMRCKYDIFRLAKLPALLRKLNPDIIHAHLFHADFAARLSACFLGKRPVVSTVHVAEMRFRPWQFVLAKLLAGYCQKTICVSPSVMKFYSQKTGLPAERLGIIMNGIDTSLFLPDRTGSDGFRKQMSIPADELTLSFVGRLDRQKGVDIFLDALQKMSQAGRQLTVLLAGDGPQRPMVDEFSRHSPPGIKVHYLGHVKNIPQVLAASDIFVMPSRWEGYGLAAAEAMSVGLPVIGTRIAGLSDVIQDGQTGVLIAPEDSEALAGAITRLADNKELRNSLGLAGRKYAVENLGIERFIAEHEKLYTKLLADESAGKTS